MNIILWIDELRFALQIANLLIPKQEYEKDNRFTFLYIYGESKVILSVIQLRNRGSNFYFELFNCCRFELLNF